MSLKKKMIIEDISDEIDMFSSDSVVSHLAKSTTYIYSSGVKRFLKGSPDVTNLQDYFDFLEDV